MTDEGLDAIFKTIQDMCGIYGEDKGISGLPEAYKIEVSTKMRPIVLAALRKHGYYLTSRNTIRKHK